MNWSTPLPKTNEPSRLVHARVPRDIQIAGASSNGAEAWSQKNNFGAQYGTLFEVLATRFPAEGNQEEATRDDISVTEKSVAEVVLVLLDRHDRNLTQVTDNDE